MKMPEIDGYEVLEILKNDDNFQNIPIIAITASAMKKDEKTISRMYDTYLRNPASKSNLFLEVMKFL